MSVATTYISITCIAKVVKSEAGTASLFPIVTLTNGLEVGR